MRLPVGHLTYRPQLSVSGLLVRGMRFRLILPLALLAMVLMAPAGAAAKSRYVVGLGDQNPQMFSDPNFKSLNVKKVRVIVPWNWQVATNDPAALDAYLTSAQIDNKRALVAFSEVIQEVLQGVPLEVP
jgi:hypothetical protein